jgi:hypothetical protein
MKALSHIFKETAMKATEPKLTCSICQRPIEPENGWTRGHNAMPVNNGRCCGECNATVVLPARIALFRRGGEQSDT